MEVGNQLVVTRVRFLRHRLQTSRPVNVSYRGNLRAALRLYLIDHQHRRRGMRLLEIISDIFFQDRRREWPERFALFDPRVEHVLHFGAARIDYDRSIAERTRAELHTPLKPTDNQAL